MTEMIRKFFTGFRTLFFGMSMIRRDPDILKLAIIPFIIDFLVLAGIFIWGFQRVPGWVEKGISWAVPSGSDSIFVLILYYPLLILAWGAFLGLLLFLGYVLAGIIASPFNSLLAEKTLEKLRAKPVEEFSFKRWVSVSLRMFWTSILKSLLFLCYGAIFFGVSFIPVLGIVASIGLLLIMTFDSADYSFEILEFNLSRRLRFFRKNFIYFLGSSASLGLTLLIPGLNFLLFPASVVGHAELVQKRMKDRNVSQRSYT